MDDVPPARFELPAKLLQVLGPGLITGVADDDPSGIAAYSQIGAEFRYGLAWTLVFSYPLMVAMQEITARWPGHRDWQCQQSGRHYPVWLSGNIVLLLSANLINLGADLGATRVALKLLIGGPARVCVLLFGKIFTHYARYVSILK